MIRFSVVLFVALVFGGAGMAMGAWYGEHQVKLRCINDMNFSVIDGEEFACINKAQFIGRFLRGERSNGNA